jgi:succinate dehydrogenase hydrophobic anchor subunit
MSWKESIMKNWRQRLSAILLILALIVLLDEIVKEGYTIDFYDFVSPEITHEKLFLALLILAILVGVRLRRAG